MSGFEPIAAQAVAAEVGTTALASEVVAANALAGANLAAYTPAVAGSLAAVPAAGMAGMAAGLGSLGSAVPGMYGVGTATGIPTLTQQLATASPEVLAQIQGALQPAMINNPALASGLSGAPLSGQFSSAELANITGNIPTAGPGIETAYANTGNLANSGVTPDMLQAPVPETIEAVGSKLSPIEEHLALKNAAAQINPQTNPFGSIFDMAKGAYQGFKAMEPKDKLLYGGVASLAAPTIMGMFKDKKELGGITPYDGPLSKYSFDPASYRAQQLAQPDPYRARYAEGGISDLGGYSDGGRMLKGPGDGMSDNIPASIADKQPARLANEEFVIPADVVSHLGNGSSEAGAKQLYKMMDRVRQARTGNKKQGKQIKPAKYMPI
jgi:hypothetical protein